jgi:hypothetical protein
MGRRIGGRALVGTRLLFAAVALSALAPIPAHADVWCDIFNVGCGGGGSTTQSNTQRDAPEIDPGALANAIALAAGGAAILRDRARRRR